jgi:hypothetical protein
MPHKERALPVGVLVIGLLVVLAAIGIVAGLWSKNLVINGTVETGDLRVDWEDPSCQDRHPWNDPDGSGSSIDDGEYLGKDVGWTTAEVNPDDHQILDLTVHNGYPSYFVDCQLEWRNTGSIPVNFAGFAFVAGGGLTGCDESVISGQLVLDCDQLTAVMANTIPQTDPGVLRTRSFKLHIEQPAEQSDCSATGDSIPGVLPWQIGGFAGGVDNHANNNAGLTCTSTQTYSFHLKLCVAQWNEAANLNQCVDSLQHEGPPSGPGDGDGIPYWQDTEGPPGNTNGVAGADDCTDGVDNDGNALTDAADPDC